MLLNRLLRTVVPQDGQRFRFVLALLGIVVSKSVHMCFSLGGTPVTTEWIVFFPTFWVYEVLALALMSFAIYLPPGFTNPGRRVLSLFAFVFVAFFGYFLPFFCAFAASGEVWLYHYTKLLVIWRDAFEFSGRVDGAAALLSGLGYGDLMVESFLLLLAAARLEPWISGTICKFLPFLPSYSGSQQEYGRLPEADAYDSDSEYADDEEKNMANIEVYDGDSPRGTVSNGCVRYLNRRGLVYLAGFLALCVFSAFRPARNYDLIVYSVPLVCLEMFPMFSAQSSQPGGGDSSIHYSNSLMALGFPFYEQAALRRPEDFPDTEWLVNLLPNPPPKGFNRYTKEREAAWMKWAETATQASKDGSEQDLHLAPPGYHHAFDPMKIDNLGSDILPELTAENPPANEVGKAKPLKDVKIRNVILLNLESTRRDVFPLREGNDYVNRLKKGQTKDKKYDDIVSLTPTATYLLGKEEGKGGAGGLILHGAASLSSYSQKSYTCSNCGSQPLPVSYIEENVGEYYQPCLPHIFKLLGNTTILGNATAAAAANATASDDDWKSAPWITKYLQTPLGDWDRQWEQLELTGFEELRKEQVTGRHLEQTDAKFYNSNPNFTTSWGFPESALNPYIRDVIQTSKSENKRFFMSMWSITPHWEWITLPDNIWKNRHLTEEHDWNAYVNLIGFVDSWLKTLIDMLKEEGVYEETLIVIEGDHGVSPSNESPEPKLVPNMNPFHKLFQIPLVFHHPNLPAVHLNGNATNLSVVPTILDLLLNSDSMVKGSDQERILKALLPSYEGQSLIRPLQHKNAAGLEDFRFTLPNPGGYQVIVDSSDPEETLRFSVSTSPECEYYASRMSDDPNEAKPLTAWTRDDILDKVRERWGEGAWAWCNKAADLVDWWRVEANRRYQYRQFAKPEPTAAAAT